VARNITSNLGRYSDLYVVLAIVTIIIMDGTAAAGVSFRRFACGQYQSFPFDSASLP